MAVLIILLATAALLAAVLGSTGSGRPPSPTEEARPVSLFRVPCRILFVTQVGDEVLLDCVVGEALDRHPCLVPGTPFSLRVEPGGPPWFREAAYGVVEHWAEEGTLVDIDVHAGKEGDHADLRGEHSRLRVDVRSRAGLG